MPKNHYTAELIDLFCSDLPQDDPKFGVFIVMEWMETDLKKLMD